MIAVIQRAQKASVSVAGEVKGKINQGLVVLLGVGQDDAEEDLAWLASKILNLRIFADEDGKMNRSVRDVDGGILLISQFTLLASTKKGNRPSYIKAASPQSAEGWYEQMAERLGQGLGQAVQKGVFGADMAVSLINDGPVTIVIDTKDRK